MKLHSRVLSLHQVFALICWIASTVHSYRLGGYTATTRESGVVDSISGGHLEDRSSSSCMRLSLVKTAYAGLMDGAVGSSTLKALSITTKGTIEAEGSGNPCRIKVIGVGGGGGNAVNRMLDTPAGTAHWCDSHRTTMFTLTVAYVNHRSLWLRVVDCQYRRTGIGEE